MTPELRDRRGWRILTHGLGGYVRGCRCDVCREDTRAYQAAIRAAGRQARKAAAARGQVYVAEGITHGSSGHTMHGCRCQICCRARKANDVRYQRTRAGAR